MEETLVELKANCAGLIADRLRVQRELQEIDGQIEKWEKRAGLSMEKGREDLAREALLEKKRYRNSRKTLAEELTRFDGLTEQARADIQRLEEKIQSARKKQRLLVQRHRRAESRLCAERNIRRADRTDAVIRFESYERKIDRIEAAAELAGPRREGSLESEFANLEHNDSVEQELAALRQRVAQSKHS
ncbi:MAG: phage shock protein A, partial [Chitinivibrionales bacterium]|nr:phage shock protein A [Chitinivibrionales bacterium]MBD3358060.1 phage shock protein A [Chitinivibrionales bacterium]